LWNQVYCNDNFTCAFVTRVDRPVALLRLPKGDEIELALDEGVVEAEDATAPIHEVEMELNPITSTSSRLTCWRPCL
jgi:inorganic triphosphatase YgiF